jgi:hypothetical protein
MSPNIFLHSAFIELHRHLQVRQVSGQTPRIFFSDLPMNQQVDRINLFGGQISVSQPNTLSGLLNITADCLPATLFDEPNACISFLTQDIEPMPLVQPAQDRNRAKSTVSEQENSVYNREQGMDERQQGRLFPGCAMPFDMLDPGPCNGNSLLSYCQVLLQLRGE